MKIVAVTACPTGIAQTYMAAERLKSACRKIGVMCKVETQGAMGVDNIITEEDLREVKGCILTTDMPIKNRERFEGLPTVEVSVLTIIKNPEEIVEELLQGLERK